MSIIAGGLRSSDGAPVVAQSAYAYGKGTTRFVGFLYTCPPGVAQHREPIPKTVRLQGGYYWIRGASLGDRVTLSVVDVDNVLGGGNGVVLSEYVKDMPVAPWDHQQEISASTAGEIIEGLYLQITYLNAGTQNVDLGITYRWFEM